jgi:hypothetical protein
MSRLSLFACAVRLTLASGVEETNGRECCGTQLIQVMLFDVGVHDLDGVTFKLEAGERGDEGGTSRISIDWAGWLPPPWDHEKKRGPMPAHQGKHGALCYLSIF